MAWGGLNRGGGIHVHQSTLQVAMLFFLCSEQLLAVGHNTHPVCCVTFVLYDYPLAFAPAFGCGTTLCCALHLYLTFPGQTSCGSCTACGQLVHLGPWHHLGHEAVDTIKRIVEVGVYSPTSTTSLMLPTASWPRRCGGMRGTNLYKTLG